MEKGRDHLLPYVVSRMVEMNGQKVEPFLFRLAETLLKSTLYLSQLKPRHSTSLELQSTAQREINGKRKGSSVALVSRMVEMNGQRVKPF